MGCARDIVEYVGVPRFWWSDFPLGHSAGKPHDNTSQHATLLGALDLFEQARKPRTTRQSEQIWAPDESWKADFMSIKHLDAKTIAAMKRRHEQDRAALHKIKQG